MIHPSTQSVMFIALVVGLTSVSRSPASGPPTTTDKDLAALSGEWLYVEDRTESRALEDRQPPMSVQFTLRVEKDAVVMPRSKGDERINLDGSVTEVAKGKSISRYRGGWKDGVLAYDSELVNAADKTRLFSIRRQFRLTPDGLLVTVELGENKQVALYRHPQDIAMPRPAQALIADINWLAGAWVGTRRTSSIEERWSPPRGGAMLGVSRTVRGDKMIGFEFLRIVERDGGLVYVAQPGGRTPTEFVLTTIDKNRAVFQNPRHDFPQQIEYKRSAGGTLTAGIGFINGGRPRLFEFKRETK